MEACNSASKATSVAWNAHIGDYERQSGLLRGAREKLARGYEDLKREQDDLVRENDGAAVSDGDLLEINAGGRPISTTRRTLTQIKGSRLEALFSGRWEKRLLRDEDGRIFLDVNPDCFQALVDFLNEKRITAPDTVVDPPDAGDENEVYLERLLRSLGMDDLSSVAPRGSELIHEEEASVVEDWENFNFDEFPEEVHILLYAERQALVEARERLSERRHAFCQEKEVLEYFVGGGKKDIVWLDVSGALMAVKRSTLGMCEDSVLAKQFNDPLWEQKGVSNDRLAVEEWTPEQVEAWAVLIKGFPIEAAAALREDDVNGVHLLAMRQENFRDLGFKSGVRAVLTNAIEELQKSNKPGPAFIEHSSYCFGKVIDQLRVRAMQRAPDSFLPAPRVKERERKRFKSVVGYYFPGDAASFILGGGLMETNILTPSHIDQVATWLEEDGVSNNFELLYRASRDGWSSSDFHSNCDSKGKTLTVVRSTEGYIFGGFADMPWLAMGNFIRSPKAFVFGLQIHNSSQPIKFRQKAGAECYAIFPQPNYGPTFGSGHDLHISDHPNESNRSHANIGSAYDHPSGVGGRKVLTGSDKFLVAEFEVFQVR